ncbi:helix-turn-helix domain-containing protein [Chitinophaga sp. XS-30]|uniref:helix-turn-helix transcriptional regulator n=1 Tax=Chitinophaga sp. XS-30 TaxID=2604421 RepID=UPI0011DDF6CC|nr:helix-turn-helix domain-containing protein [Chitinophaga sp. XS-30]QEH42940.1 helix-turn-helix domain-containing protein [Chitinophaga sp. XS-30]
MYQQIDPPKALAHLVCFFYVMEHHSADEQLQPLLPSGTEIMGWQYSGNWRVKYTYQKQLFDYVLPDFYTVGQQTMGYTLSVEGTLAGICGAALQPGSLAQLCRTPATAFTSCIQQTAGLFGWAGVSAFIDRYRKTGDLAARIAVLTDFYTQLSRQVNIETGLLQEVLRHIFSEKGCITVRQLCERFRLNERYLQRLFRDKIGVSPNQYIKTTRFNNIFIELSREKVAGQLGSMAMLYNYYDLPHFAKEYRFFFNAAPTQPLLEKFALLRDLVSDSPYLLEVQKRHLESMK